MDRIVDGEHAVLLVGKTEKERIVPVAELPEGAGEGTWIRVRFQGGVLVEASIDEKESMEARQRISDKMDRLRKRGRRT